MAKGISTAIAVDTRTFLSGVKTGVVEPLQSVETTMQQVTAAGDKAGTQLEQSFREQQGSTQRLKTEIDDLNAHIKQGSAQSSAAMTEHSHAAAVKVEEGFTEMKDSAKQNSIQTAASFDGSFSSLAGGLQGLVSEFAAGFGPAGLAAGIVAAGGIGLVSTAVDNLTQSTQADKQATADLAKQYLAAGTTGKRAFSDVSQAIQDMATNTDGSAIITLQDAWSAAVRAGGDYASVVQAIATEDPQQIQTALQRVDALRKQDDAWTTLGKTSVDVNSQATLKTQVQQAAVTQLHDALSKAKTEARDAGRAQELAAEAGLSKFQQKADMIDLLTKGYQDSASSVTDYLDKESGLFDVSKYLHAMEQRADELDHYQEHLAQSRLSPEAKSFLDAQGADAAAAMLNGYRHASKDQQQELDHIWSTAGQKNVQSYGDAVGRGLGGLSIVAPPIHLAPPTHAQIRAALAQAQAYIDAHPLRAGAVAYTRNGKPLF